MAAIFATNFWIDRSSQTQMAELSSTAAGSAVQPLGRLPVGESRQPAAAHVVKADSSSTDIAVPWFPLDL